MSGRQKRMGAALIKSDDNEERQLPKALLLHPSVDYFDSKPKNNIKDKKNLE